MTCLWISDWTLGTSPSRHLLKHAPWFWSDMDITVSHHLMFKFFFYTLPRVCTVQCNYSHSMSSLLSFLHSLVCTVNGPYSQAVTKLLCCIIFLTLGYSLLFLGAPHAPLSPVAVTLGALGLCFIVLIFKNKSVVCVICFHVFLLHLAHWHQIGSSKFDIEHFLCCHLNEMFWD